MKAGKLKTLSIMLRSGFSILKLSIKAIIETWQNKLSRDHADQYMRDWSKYVLSLVEASVEVFEEAKLQLKQNECYMIMLNHSSLYDIPISLLAIPQSIRMITKKELFSIPFFGRAMRAAEHIKIDRQNRDKAIADLERAKEKMRSGIMIWAAPEGTRSEDGLLKPFKKGCFITAIQAKAKIIPVGIRGAAELLPAKTWQFQLKQNIEVHIGKIIDAAKYSLENKESLIATTEQEIARLSGQPTAAERAVC